MSSPVSCCSKFWFCSRHFNIAIQERIYAQNNFHVAFFLKIYTAKVSDNIEYTVHLSWLMIHDELLVVRGFTVNSVDMLHEVHELLRHYIGGAHFILHVLLLFVICICIHVYFHIIFSFSSFLSFLVVLNACVVYGFSFFFMVILSSSLLYYFLTFFTMCTMGTMSTINK